MSLATRITAGRHGDRVILGNYAAQPVLLNNVKRSDQADVDQLTLLVIDTRHPV